MAAIVRRALRACDARTLLSAHLANVPSLQNDRCSVVSAGKAAEQMLDAFASVHAGRVDEVVVSRGAHPLPDARSVNAGEAALRVARSCRSRGTRLVTLLSGGASAMLAIPAAGLTLDDKVAATRLLLGSGLPIASINVVRKHLSGIKGGRLAAAAGRSITFAISDVHAPVEDDPAVIGSGPTVADPSTFAQAVDAVTAGHLVDLLPPAVLERLRSGAGGLHDETVKPGDPRIADAEFVIVGSRRDAMDGVRVGAETRGYHVVAIDRPIVGDVSDGAATFLSRARALSAGVPRPCCVVGSGETTVTLSRRTEPQLGGRNQEFTLGVGAELPALGECVFASIGTDGIDGSTDAAGAIADDLTLERAAAAGLDRTAALRDHASYAFFRALDDLLITGPTGTNVGDLQVLLLA